MKAIRALGVLWIGFALACSSQGEGSASRLSPEQRETYAGSAGNSANAWSSSGGGGGTGGGGGSASAYREDSDNASQAENDGGTSPDQIELPIAANPFVLTATDPFSTFGADVDTASYDIFRRDIGYGYLSSPETVRLEDFVNYFDYSYAPPAVDAPHPFAIALAATRGLTGRQTSLLRVGIQAVQPPPTEKKQANIVFLVDVSGSMAEELPLVQHVLSRALDTLDPEDRVSIVVYASDTGVRLQPTPISEKETIAAAIDGLVSGGSTNGGAGIHLAYEQASAGFLEDGINHVVLCTDGDFNVGVSSTDALLALIKEKRMTGVTLTALGFGSDNLNDDMMERVSNAGDGIYSVIVTEQQAERYAEERMLGTIVHVAKDVKLQVEFNPTFVRAYRLLGYENRAIADNDFRNDRVDAGEIGAGHRVTALYELVLGTDPVPDAAGEAVRAQGEAGLSHEIGPLDLVLVKIRYKRPGATDADAATEVATALAPAAVAVDPSEVDADFRWVAAIAAFAEILKGSSYADKTRLDELGETFEAQREVDADRAELVELYRKARALLP